MIYQRGPLQWIDSGGGPLILLSGEYLSAWSGHDLFEQQDDDIQRGMETDYERACAVEGYIGLLAVDGGQGLVLGEEPMSTAWWSMKATQGILVRWVYGDDQVGVVTYLEHVAEEAWKPSGVTFVVGRQPLYLFDAAWAGQEVQERLVVILAEGHYAVDIALVRPDDRTELVLHRVRHLGE